MRDKSEHTKLNEIKWDSRSETFDDKRFHYFRFIQKRCISLLNLKPDSYCLDVGCGTGWGVRYTANLVKEGGKSYGIDISSKMIEKAITSSRDHSNAYFYKANSEELPFGDSFFDFIISTNSFHHYFNPSRALGEIYRVLKPDGRAYITDLTSDDFIMKMVDKRVRIKEPEHVKFYSTPDFLELFAIAKLKYIGTKLILFPIKVHIAEK